MLATFLIEELLMSRKHLLTTFAGALTAILLSLATHAQDWPPPYPEGGDSRVYVDGITISEDRVTVGVPYNYGLFSDAERNFIQEWADWACGLYQRVAISVSFSPSDFACDEMGPTAAERSGDCWQYWHFACAIPP